ncbi:MAG: restriction endonuclease subunit S [Pseudanabaena sp.]|nr:MAG: restriction endonuclease subunit S [Pseudanabaena sp.]
MSGYKNIALKEIMASKLGSIDPSKFKQEIFDLYSIPAFDSGKPEVISGSEIGSTKQIVQPNDVLLSKIVPHIRRTWIVGKDNGRRIIASGEWIVFRSKLIEPRYLRHVLVSDLFHAHFMQTVSGVGGSLLRARPAQVASIEVPFPPISEQKRIAEILDRTQSLISKRKEAIAKLDTLTQSIFVAMFGDPELKKWQIETVNDVVHPSRGSIRTGPFGSQLLHSEFVAEGIAVLGIDNAVANEFRWGERRFISEAKYQELKRYTVKPNDVIITIMGTCGKCAIVPDDIPLAVNTKHLCCITLNQKKCLPRFLQAYFLFHPISNRYLEQTKKGAIMSGLNMSIIQAMPIFCPPLALQKEFAQRVEAVEKLKATHRASLSQLEALFDSLQHRAFRGEL